MSFRTVCGGREAVRRIVEGDIAVWQRMPVKNSVYQTGCACGDAYQTAADISGKLPDKIKMQAEAQDAVIAGTEKQMECAELCDRAKALASDSAAIQAQAAFLEESISAHQMDIAVRQKEIDGLDREIENYKADKKISDILKMIPIVNTGSVICSLAAQDEKKIRDLQEEVSQISRYLEDLEKELADLREKESRNEEETVRIQDEIRQLGQEILSYRGRTGRFFEGAWICILSGNFKIGWSRAAKCKMPWRL